MVRGEGKPPTIIPEKGSEEPYPLRSAVLPLAAATVPEEALDQDEGEHETCHCDVELTHRVGYIPVSHSRETVKQERKGILKTTSSSRERRG